MEEIKKMPVTAALVLMNLLAFLVVEFTGFSDDVLHMLEFGAAYTPYIVDNGEIYRLVTCMFLHFGTRHLINNMLLLLVLGSRLEALMGKLAYLAVYFVGGVAGNLLSMLLELRSGEFAVSAGASGAVFAVMGAMIYVLLRNRGRVEDLSVRQMVFMAALSLYFGFASSGVDNAAHVGGLLGGFLMAVLFYHPRKIRKEVP